MSAVITISGHITPEGGLVVDEPVPLPAGRVRVSVQSASGSPGDAAPRLFIEDEEWQRRKALMDSAIGCLSDSEAQEILRIVEQEFEQVDPDDWD
jgi:hypothetical protein